MIIALPSVMATLYSSTLYYSNQGDVWTIPTEKDYSMKDVQVDSIVVLMYQSDETGITDIIQVYPYKIGMGQWQLKLWFATDLPPFPEYANFTVVTGDLSNGDSFSAQGPGWAYRWG